MPKFAASYGRLADVAVSANGTAIATWLRIDASGSSSLWSSRYANASWSAATKINLGNNFPYSPKVAMDSVGNAAVVWAEGTSSQTNVWSNRYAVGASWGVAAAIENASLAIARSPKIVFDGNGNTIAVWESNSFIYANRFAAGAWSSPVRLDNTSRGGYSPALAVNANGNAVAAWSSGENTASMWANEYE